MEKWFVDFLGKFRLYQYKDPDHESGEYNVLEFGSYDELVEHAKTWLKQAEIFDYNEWGTIILDNGNVGFKSQFGISRDVRNRWEQIDLEDYDEVSCRSCGDGGCIHCDPNFFL